MCTSKQETDQLKSLASLKAERDEAVKGWELEASLRIQAEESEKKTMLRASEQADIINNLHHILNGKSVAGNRFPPRSASKNGNTHRHDSRHTKITF